MFPPCPLTVGPQPAATEARLDRPLVLSVWLAATGGNLLFGDRDGFWVLLGDDGELKSRFRQIGGVAPDDAAVSPDGKRWAVTISANPKKPELLLFASLDSPPRRIQSRGNVLDGVAFSSDGEWVYFSSNDYKQPRFANQPMLYAQIYRVRFTGGEPERLSLSRGCHMWPKPLNARSVVVSHATCVGGRSLEVLDLKTGAERVLLPATSDLRETSPHSSGKQVLITRTVPDGTEFRVWDLNAGSSKLWATLPLPTPRIRPQWAGDGKHVLFQSNSRVWKITESGAVSQVVELGGTP